MKPSIKQQISRKVSSNAEWNKKILHWKGSYDEIYKMLNGKKIKK